MLSAAGGCQLDFGGSVGLATAVAGNSGVEAFALSLGSAVFGGSVFCSETGLFFAASSGSDGDGNLEGETAGAGGTTGETFGLTAGPFCGAFAGILAAVFFPLPPEIM